MSMKTIWFIDKDTAPIEEYFTQQRAVRQAQYFQSKGFDVKVICSARVHNSTINHLEGINQKEVEQVYDDVPFFRSGRSGSHRYVRDQRASFAALCPVRGVLGTEYKHFVPIRDTILSFCPDLCPDLGT